MALFGRPSAEDQRRAEVWRRWILNRNPLAIASLVLGVFSLIEFGALLIFGIAGIVLGALALRQLGGMQDDAMKPPFGHRLAWAGIALSVISLIIAAYIYFVLPHHPPH